MDDERLRLESEVAQRRSELDDALGDLSRSAERLAAAFDVRRQLRRVPTSWLIAAGAVLALWWMRRR